ncbi:DUF262 domain-containing HNH endonuclease family protein [Flavobacterium branchiophilum]|uniref:DUF262 domain-containing protein n=1 Tax=Flavobacterium branchiophilum TaxID=55197 RepID=A0A2H3KGX0_9FLAO|nr:DUF262 domain-containing HNH endonuclease family protein [Flavobacterium branchiophilum]PDS23124.1 hypothetical protein B0A77_11435 [Flavobacterium branchiophilum]
MKLEIEKAFLTEGRSVYDYFQRPGVGFYIPLYQREYSWDKDNVEQLIEDIEKGVAAMINDEDEIRFLGTIITVVEKDKKRIQPLDIQALPTAVEKLIDGQQRMSTIAIMGTLLYKQFSLLQEKINLKSGNKDELVEICQIWKEKLIDIFSFDLKSGKPKRKPKIVRGFLDEWSKDGNVDEKYISEISNYLAKFILAIEEQKNEFPEIPKLKSRFTSNARIIDTWLRKIITIHERDGDDDCIPPAWEILKKDENHEFIWSYPRENLFKIINLRTTNDKKSDSYITSSIVQLISISHYLLERCCFTIIQPINEDWAFDMFQSLNASGTPLTAIETFKPLVVNTTELNNEKYENSASKISYNKVENLFKDAGNAATKSKLTNEFLTSLAIVLNAWKLESHFSSQRKYLERIYSSEISNYSDQCDLIKFIGNYADFYKNVWLEYKGTNQLPIDKISVHQDADLASMLILFLKKSNHRMAITILNSLYSEVLNGSVNSISNFVEGVKAVSAFYILWRACDSNAGIDNIYRNFFKGKEPDQKARHWLETKAKINIPELKKYLKDSLIKSKEDWLEKSKSYLKYDNSSTVCRIALIISSHDTVVDDLVPGLMKKGKPNCSPYLNLDKWNSDDLKDIEHVAPQNNDGSWDSELYDLNSKLFDSIGNLTLLPTNINISASNKGWNEKFLYYQHLGTKDAQKAQELSTRAVNSGIKLNKSTLDILTGSSYNEHILPLLALGENGNWNLELVKQRRDRILDLLWEQVIKWL